MDRRRFLLTSLGGTFAGPLAASAQPRKVYRIGLMFPRAHGMFPPFADGLRDLGWIEGRNIVFEARAAELPDGAEAAAREFVAMRVDVIATILTGRAVVAMRATTSIPIVMLTSGYPVEVGLAKSYARPDGNVTGNSIYAGAELFGKHVEILKTMQPRMSRLALLWSYVPPVTEVGESELGLQEIRRAAAALGVAVRVWETRSIADVDAALIALSREGTDALYVTASQAHADPDTAARIARFAVDHRLPSMADFGGTAFRAGLLVTYSADLTTLARQAAGFVDRILRGASAAELPIERPSRFDLLINLKTAKALGLTVPPSLLLRADRLIE